MQKKCPDCKLVNYPTAEACIRCGHGLLEADGLPVGQAGVVSQILRRILVFVTVTAIVLVGFYSSLVFSARPLNAEQKRSISSAIDLLESKGFRRESFLLRRIAVFRSEDNWLNASVQKENAFAATNFPFEIVTIYPDFLTYPADDVERAAILLHEAKHLEGADERAAYEFVWRNRARLGWRSELYTNSRILPQVRGQTREVVPNLFVCDVNPYSDCTERRQY